MLKNKEYKQTNKTRRLHRREEKIILVILRMMTEDFQGNTSVPQKEAIQKEANRNVPKKDFYKKMNINENTCVEN